MTTSQETVCVEGVTAVVQVAVVFVVVVDVSETSAGFTIDCVEAGLLIAQSID